MWFNSGSWQAQLGLFLAHIALSTASGQSIRGAVLNHRVTAGKKPMHAIWGMRATLRTRTRTRTRLPARPGIMNRMSKCVQNPSHALSVDRDARLNAAHRSAWQRTDRALTPDA